MYCTFSEIDNPCEKIYQIFLYLYFHPSVIIYIHNMYSLSINKLMHMLNGNVETILPERNENFDLLFHHDDSNFNNEFNIDPEVNYFNHLNLNCKYYSID